MKIDNLSVCLLNDSFPPLIDGVANTVMNYADVIQRKHGEAIVAVPYFPGAKDNYPYEVVRYHSVNTVKLVGYRAGNPFLPSTVDAVKKKCPNIIHSHCPFMSTYLARTLRGAVKAPVIFTYHTMFDIDIAKALQSKLLQKATINKVIANIEACDEVWVVSSGAGENLKRNGYKGDYIVMENGVDLPKGRACDKTVGKIIKKYSLPSDRPIYLFVGRMMWYKGAKIILDSLAALKNDDKEFLMVFIGDGTDKKEMEDYAETLGLGSSCLFTGAIHDREELRGWYSISDLFLFPSTYDTNGLVVREAAACGTPSLLINRSCAAEGVVHGETGLIMEENSSDMTRILKSYGFDRQALNKIGQNAMDNIYVSWEESVDRAVKRYEYVIENYNRGRFSLTEDNVSDEAFEAIGKTLEAIAKAKKIGSNMIGNVKEHGKELTSEMYDRFQSFKDKND